MEELRGFIERIFKGIPLGKSKKDVLKKELMENREEEKEDLVRKVLKRKRR